MATEATSSAQTFAAEDGVGVDMVQLCNQWTLYFGGAPLIHRFDTSCNLKAFVTDESDGSRKYITLEQALTLAKASEKTPSTVGDLADPSKRVLNVESRDSQLSQSTFYFQVTPQKPLADRPASHIEITDDFEFVQYGVGGHFSEHEDRRREVSITRDGYRVQHTNTVCIYPPQNVTGGHLRFKRSDHTITMPSDRWLVVVFEIGMSHKSNPVTAGEKLMFKGLGLSFVHEAKASAVAESRRGMCD